MKHRKYYLLWLIFVLMIISCGNGDITFKQDISLTFLRVDGTKILNDTGEQIFLRGFNSGPFKFASYKDNRWDLEDIDNFNTQNYEYYLTEDDFKNMQSMDANVLRLHSFLKFWTLETESYQYDSGFLDLLDSVIDKACQNGIYVIITMAQAGQNEPQNNDSFGHALFINKDLRRRVIAGWKFVAQRYSGNPCIAGYDILNEPDPPSKEALYSFYSEVISEIRSVDPDHIIFLDRKHFPKENEIRWGGDYTDENIVLETHEYVDANEQHEPAEYYPTKQEMEQVVEEFYLWPELQTHPLFIGEFSALWDAGDEGLRWTEDFIDLMNLHGVHWTYFPFKNMWGVKRGLYKTTDWWLRDWTEEQQGNLTVTTTQLERLLTPNMETNPDIRDLLEHGFQGD